MRACLWGSLLLAAVLAAGGVRAGDRETDAAVAGEAVQSHQGVGRAVAQVRLSQGQVAWLEDFLEEVKAMKAEGRASATDVAQVESRLALARATLAQRIGALRAAEARYRAVVGTPPPGAEERPAN